MIWLLLLGLITYFVVQRVSGITRTPVWLLWLVAMMPALILGAWAIAHRGQGMMPRELVIALFVGCLVLYVFLIRWGRIAKPVQTPRSDSALDPITPQPLNLPEPTPEIQAEQPLRPITQDEEDRLQGCFLWSIYYLQHIEYRPQAVICRGKLRASPEIAYRTVRENIEAQFSDRFYVVFQEGHRTDPFFALVPNPYSQVKKPQTDPFLSGARRKLVRPGIASGLAVVTLITTVLAGLQMAGRVISSPLVLIDGLPYAIPVMTFFALRGIGYFLTTRKYKIAATLPYFIPVIPLSFFPLGTVGAFIQIRSPIPDRKALFDVGAVGAMLGLCVSIPLLAWGLTQSEVVGLSQRAGIFDFYALNPRFSIVFSLLSKLAFGSDFVAQTAIKPHPFAIAGWIGLLFTAFNLMPVGQLDGGRMIHAMFGQRTGAFIGQIARFLLLAFSVVQPHLLVWAILLLLLPAMDEPALNDVTEIDSFRDAVGLALLTVLILIILPTPKFLMNWLQI
ncbi:MAG: site-2 protease family protein [Myxacorys chilensis ATA2-1-KO14]|jgi:membrane-associated protease RseP (regulator of RpoE activity)|nr:site-2 protease family protein [Myxacorys chilensis ATA2-1-KO14]